MNLAVVALGNGTVKEALFVKGELIKKIQCSVWDWPGPHDFQVGIDKKILISVNPALEIKFSRYLGGYSSPRFHQLRGFKIHYPKPTSLGKDRAAGALGALKLFPGHDIILIDCGTAMTLNLIRRDGHFLGGLILAGMGLNLRALSENTGLLPELKPQFPVELFATSTEASLAEGSVLIRTLGLKSWITKIKADLLPEARVVGTGGELPLFRQAALFDDMNEDLVLWGALAASEREGNG